MSKKTGISVSDLTRMSVYNLLKIAGDPLAPAALLATLAGNARKSVRWEVARNRNTPEEVLEMLASDKENDVRKCVALNSNTPQKTLLKLTKDESPYILWSVAGNANSSVEILEILAEHAHAFVRAGVELALTFRTDIHPWDKALVSGILESHKE